MASHKLQIIFGAKGAKKVEAHIARLKARVKGFASGTAKLFRGAAVGVGLIGVAAVAVGKKLVASYMISAEADAKRAAVNKATGHAAGFTNGELEKQARALEKITGTNESVISSMQGVLLTFRNIKGDQFEDASLASLDMAAAMRKSGASAETAEQGVIQLAKALNDPIKNLSALSRIGVTFTDQQRDQIKVMVESGRVADAQKVILSELKNEFGGVAEAVNGADHGLAEMQNELRHVGEEFGKAITDSDVFDGVIRRITEAARGLSESGYITLWAQNVRKAIKTIAPYIDKVGKGLGWVKNKFQEAAGFWGGVAGSQGSFSERMNAGVAGMSAPKELEAETDARLDAIKKERAAKEEAAEAAERAEIKRTKAVQVTTAAITAQSNAEKLAADAADLAARAQEKAAKAATERAGKVKAIAALERDIANADRGKEIAGRIAGADKEIEDNQAALNQVKDRLGESSRERRDRERNERRTSSAEERAARRLKVLKEREKQGAPLSRHSKQLLKADDLRRNVDIANQNKAAAVNNQQQQALTAAKLQREAQLAELKLLRGDLLKNLQGAA